MKESAADASQSEKNGREKIANLCLLTTLKMKCIEASYKQGFL